MNKILIIFLIAIVSCERRNDIPVEEIYNAVIGLFKGMAETEEARCAGVFTNQRTKILEIVYQCIDEIKAGTEIATAIQNAGLKLMGVEGLISECNVLQMPSLITKFTTKEGLVGIFQTLIDNIDDVYSFGEQMKTAIENKDYPGAAEAFGHILSIALEFHVNYF